MSENKKRVLIVDDEPSILSFMQITLTNLGFEVVGVATNGKIAVEKYQELTPDLVTLDILMPEYDGLYALDEIKKIDSSAKVVVVTAFQQSVMELIKLGADDYMFKPLTEERIANTFQKLFATV